MLLKNEFMGSRRIMKVDSHRRKAKQMAGNESSVGINLGIRIMDVHTEYEMQRHSLFYL